MSAPIFADIGKEYKDLNTKEFSDKVKVENTSVDGNSTFVVTLTKDDANTTGQFQHKLKIPDHGANTLTQFDTKNALKFELTHADRLAKGFKTIATTELDLTKGKRTGKLGVEYKSNHFTFNTALTHNWGGKTSALGAFVFGHSHHFGFFNGGLEAGFNFGTNHLSSLVVALANKLNAHNIVAHFRQVNSENPSLKFTTSYYYKPNESKHNLEVGGEIERDVSTGDVTINGVTAFDVDSSSRVKAKVNSSGELHLALVHTVNSHFKLSLAGNFNFVKRKVKPGKSFKINN